jgi:hypothetical protein
MDMSFNEMKPRMIKSAQNWQEVSKGWWINPKGEIIQVPSNSAHDIIAWEILDPDKIKYNHATNAILDFLDQGAIMARGYEKTIQFSLKHLDNKKVEFIKGFLLNHSYYTDVVIETGGKFHKLPASHFITLTLREIKEGL